MPQFNPLLYVEQFFWLAIVFFALYVVVAMVALPRIGAVLEERRRRIDENLDRAEKMKRDAEEVARQYEQTLANARNQAAEIYNQSVAKLAAEAEERQKALTQKLDGIIQEGEARIAEAKQAAMADVKAIAKDVVQSLTEKLVGVAAEDKAINSAVNAAIKERH